MKLILSFALTLLFTINTLSAQNKYYPLEKGKTWNYKYDGSFSGQPDQTSEVKLLDEAKTINGNEYFAMQTSLNTNGINNVLQTIFVRNGSNGSVVGVMNAEQNTEHILFPSKPWAEQTSWTSNAMGMSVTSTIVDTDGSVVTPEKTFSNCLVVVVDLGETKSKTYLQAGIGLVAVSLIINGEEKLMQYLID